LQSQDIIRAEKLSFILESLEKFKISVSEKYDSAFKQIDKFSADWELIKMELFQIGDIFDEGVAANLDQVGPLSQSLSTCSNRPLYPSLRLSLPLPLTL
jgi:hypothetical protein